MKRNATARLDLRVHLIVSKLRLGASHTCTRTRAFKATERSEVLTSRGAKRRVRYEKKRMRLNLTSFGPLHGPLRSPAAGSLRDENKKSFGMRRVQPDQPQPTCTSRGTLRCEINRAMTLTLPLSHTCALGVRVRSHVRTWVQAAILT